ncbi:MAG: FAD:protein FMN transferase [Mycoplasmatales bacterium]
MKKIILVFILLITLSGCSSKETYNEEEFDYFNFDTPINIKVYSKVNENINFETIDELVKKRLNEIELIFSRTNADSELSKLNKEYSLDNASSDLINVLNFATEYCNITNTKYDISSGTLIELWSINNENHLPTVEEIDSALKNVGCNDIIVQDNKISIPEGYIIDLGSIAKGYAADEVIKILKDNNVNSALINLGGNIQAINTKPDASEFQIGIMNPSIENKTSENIASIKINNKAVVTSGINQRYFENNGKIYHHIFDATTGYPVDSNLASVSIITSEGIKADVLSTAVFIMGIDEGLKYVETLEDVEAIFVDRDGNITQSSGINDLNIY